jgi:hypothetical protein
MAVTNTPVFVQNPKVWTATVINATSTNCIPLISPGTTLSGTAYPGAGPNGSKITGLYASTTDTSANIALVSLLRSNSSVTLSTANPSVITWPGNFTGNLQSAVLFTSPVASAFGGTIATNVIYYVYNLTYTQASSTFNIVTAVNGSTGVTGVSTAQVAYTGYQLIPQTSVSVTIGSGTLSTGLSPQNLLTTTAFAGLPVDNDGQPYLFLEPGDYLGVSVVAAVTANKVLTVMAVGGNF